VLIVLTTMLDYDHPHPQDTGGPLQTLDILIEEMRDTATGINLADKTSRRSPLCDNPVSV
jgi:hypothetical protein